MGTATNQSSRLLVRGMPGDDELLHELNKGTSVNNEVYYAESLQLPNKDKIVDFKFSEFEQEILNIMNRCNLRSISVDSFSESFNRIEWDILKIIEFLGGRYFVLSHGITDESFLNNIIEKIRVDLKIGNHSMLDLIKQNKINNFLFKTLSLLPSEYKYIYSELYKDGYGFDMIYGKWKRYLHIYR